MNDRDRLKQLRALRANVERLPASAERDWMLKEVGRRAVDIESSDPAAPIRPLGGPVEVEPAPAPRRAPAKPRQRSTRGEAARTHTRAAAAAAFLTSVRPTPPLPEGLLLSLGDDDATAAAEPQRRPAAPWSRGLRG